MNLNLLAIFWFIYLLSDQVESKSKMKDVESRIQKLETGINNLKSSGQCSEAKFVGIQGLPGPPGPQGPSGHNAEHTSCPGSFTEHADSCYQLLTTQRTTWFEALSYCQAMDATLVAIDTEQEQDYIQQMVTEAGVKFNIFWTAGNRMSGEWQWQGQGQGKALMYTNWGWGQPGTGETHGNCMFLHGNDGFQWHSTECSDKKKLLAYFICEINLCHLIDE